MHKNKKTALLNPYETYDYENAKKQIIAMQKFTFGFEINVLILTDRLFGCAIGLQEYMQNSSDITVDLAFCFDDAKMIINRKHIDFFILVGYQTNIINYTAVAGYRSYASKEERTSREIFNLYISGCRYICYFSFFIIFLSK